MTYKPPQDTLNATQRKSIGAGVYVKRERHPDEATGTMVCAASAPRGYVPGDGESQHISVKYLSRNAENVSFV